MMHKYLIIVDDQPQTGKLEQMKHDLKNEEIDLIYEQINPLSTEFRERLDNGNVKINIEKIRDKIDSIPFFKYADTIACDYNLVPEINGFDIICLIRELNYKVNKKIILYSADLSGVISEILKSGNFEIQKTNLTNLINYNVEFTKRDGYDKEVIKNIKKDKQFDFEEELIMWFHKRKLDTFNYLFPKYKGKSFGEIAVELESKTKSSIEFKKDLVEQIIAYLATINNLEND